MQKHLYTILTFFVGLLLTGCSHDDLPWEGVKNTENEVAIAFSDASNFSDFSLEALTRSSIDATYDDDGNTAINSIDVIIFTEGGAYQCHQRYETGLDVGYVMIPRAKVCEGNWYVIANADGDKLNDFFAENKTADAKSEASFKSAAELMIPEGDIFTSTNSKKDILCACAKIDEVPAANENVKTFELRKIYAKIVLTVSPECKNFLVTGTRFYSEHNNVNISGAPGTTLNLTSSIYPVPDDQSTTSTDGTNSCTHLKADGAKSITFYTLPMAIGRSAQGDGAYKYPEPRLLLEGKYVGDVDGEGTILSLDSKTTYYAYKFSEPILAGKQYNITLESVEGRGVEDFGNAFDNPVGAIVTVEDVSDTNSVITDGERVLAVADQFECKAGNATETQTQTKEVTVYWRGRSDDKVVFDTSNLPAWLTISNPSGDTSDATELHDQPGSSSNLSYKKTVFTFNVAANAGSEREYVLPFYFDKKTSLQVETVIKQQAATLELNKLVEIKFQIKRDGSQVYPNLNDGEVVYNSFNTSSDFLSSVKGITPAENGGRVRNVGLHAPMPNSESGTGKNVEYLYLIHVKETGDWTLTVPDGVHTQEYNSSTNAWWISFTDKNNTVGSKEKWAYEVIKDGIKLEKKDASENVTKTITFDIYHTGFFHNAGDNDNQDWYYYEVLTAGGSHWLDRNIGAQSAGMAHLQDDGTYLNATEWPVNSTSGGDYIDYATGKAGTKCPKGWIMPTQGDFEKLSMQKNFSTDRLPTGSVTIFAPTYRMPYNVYRDGRTQSMTLDVYFPHNRYKLKDESLKGDGGAGYYLTSTPTDQKGYYRIMKFVGMNVSAEVLNFGNDKDERKLSLRCIAEEGASSSDDTYKYSCKVKGYTHVFLYHVAADGTKTYLNTWPGKEVATVTLDSNGKVDETKSMAYLRNNTFSYVSYTNLVDNGGKLYVIFNRVVNGTVESNVNETSVLARQGIPFIDGDTYYSKNRKLDYSPVAGGSSIVTEGNWTNASSGTVTKEYRYAVKGIKSAGDWKTSNPNFYAEKVMTKNDNGTYSITLDFDSTGEFVIMQSVKSESGTWSSFSDAWGKAESLNYPLELNTDMKLKNGAPDNYNFCFSSATAGTVTITLTPSATHATAGSKLRVSRGTINYNNAQLRLKGNFNQGADNSGNDDNWQDPSNMSSYQFVHNESDQDGIYKLTLKVDDLGKFVVAENTGTDWNSFNEWKNKSGATAVLSGSSYDMKITGDANNWSFSSKGTYTLTIDWVTQKLYVEKEEAVSNFPEGSIFYIHGDFGSGWTPVRMNDVNGIWKAEISTIYVGSHTFGIRRTEKESTDTNDQKGWIWGEKNKTLELNVATGVVIQDGNNGQNWTVSGDGIYNFEFNPSDLTLKVTRTEFPVSVKYRLYWYKGSPYYWKVNIFDSNDDNNILAQQTTNASEETIGSTTWYYIDFEIRDATLDKINERSIIPEFVTDSGDKYRKSYDGGKIPLSIIKGKTWWHEDSSIGRWKYGEESGELGSGEIKKQKQSSDILKN